MKRITFKHEYQNDVKKLPLCVCHCAILGHGSVCSHTAEYLASADERC